MSILSMYTVSLRQFLTLALRSTIFGGTELDLDFTPGIDDDKHVRRPEAIPSTGLKTKRSSISDWTDFHIDELQSEDTVARRTVDQSTKSSVFPEEPSGSDSDDDFALDYVKTCITLAEKARNQGDHAKEESFLRKALAEPRRLRRLGNTMEHMDLTVLLAKTLLRQGKYSETRSLCDKMLQTKIRGDADRVLIHEGLFILARLDLLEGKPDDAMLKCKQVINGRLKLGGRDDAYYEAIALMALLKQRQGDEHEQQVYEGLLPADFARWSLGSAQSEKPLQVDTKQAQIGTEKGQGAVAKRQRSFQIKVQTGKKASSSKDGARCETSLSDTTSIQRASQDDRTALRSPTGLQLTSTTTASLPPQLTKPRKGNLLSQLRGGS